MLLAADDQDGKGLQLEKVGKGPSLANHRSNDSECNEKISSDERDCQLFLVTF